METIRRRKSSLSVVVPWWGWWEEMHGRHPKEKVALNPGRRRAGLAWRIFPFPPLFPRRPAMVLHAFRYGGGSPEWEEEEEEGVVLPHSERCFVSGSTPVVPHGHGMQNGRLAPPMGCGGQERLGSVSGLSSACWDLASRSP